MLLAGALLPLLTLLHPASARAQVVADARGCTNTLTQPTGPNASLVVDSNSGVLCVTSGQQILTLASANVSTGTKIAFGGTYVFAQLCSAYGTVNLQVLGPDGVTYETLVTKAAADSNGGTGVGLGPNAVVKVVLSGTTGCVVTLSKVPN